MHLNDILTLAGRYSEAMQLAPRDQIRNMARTLRDQGRDHPIGSGFRPVALGSLAIGPRVAD